MVRLDVNVPRCLLLTTAAHLHVCQLLRCAPGARALLHGDQVLGVTQLLGQAANLRDTVVQRKQQV